MTDIKDTTKKNKTLSLKLGTKPLIAPKRNIEAGKTVIVEKKRYKRGIGTENSISNFQVQISKILLKKIFKENTEKSKKNQVLYLNHYQKMNKKEF